MATQVTKGELMERAKEVGVDPDQSYEELREEIEINECKRCGDEFFHDTWSDGKFCSDTCQVQYLGDADHL